MIKEEKTIYLLGAGSSRGYYKSSTGIHPPLASDYFSTFYELAISGDFLVKISFIVNYIKDKYQISPENLPTEFNENIETVFADLDNLLHNSLPKTKLSDEKHFIDLLQYSKAYDQFIFWFSHVLNEIQNGDVCPIFSALINSMHPNDVIMTFNWDTILDRALFDTGLWYPDDGYCINFDEILDGEWRLPRSDHSSLKLLKLHGSTNWFGPYLTRHLQTGERIALSSADTVDQIRCLVDGTNHYDCYKDRWRPNYQPFSYFFPPNNPQDTTPLMPIIIPPTKQKLFSEYKNVFQPIWDIAKNQMKEAQRLVIIGYSFPKTDIHAFSLLENFIDGSSKKQIVIVDPYPDSVSDRVSERIKGRAEIIVNKGTLSDYLGLKNVKLDYSKSQLAKLHKMEKTKSKAILNEDEFRESWIIDLLVFCNLNDVFIDISTFSGERYKNAQIIGEFATYMVTGSIPSIKEYQLTNIQLKKDDGSIVKISVSDIWLIYPVGKKPLSDNAIKNMDSTKIDDSLKEMIRDGFHCVNNEEVEYFIKRFLAS
jgi:hypothetical protein